MKLIYIAGPYRPYTEADGTWIGTPMNIRNAEVTAVNLVNELGHLGLFPVVPHLNTRDFETQVELNSDQYFLNGTMALLERCDAVLLTMPNADVVSVGTKAEVHRAYQLGIQVYRSFDALRRAAQDNQLFRLPARYLGFGISPTLHDQITDRERASRIREEFMQLHPEVRKVWENHGPLTVHDFSKLEERMLSTLPVMGVKAIDLQPGDTLESGTVVRSTEQLDGFDEKGRTVKVVWTDGSTENYHFTEVFRVVLRHRHNWNSKPQ